MHCAFVIHGGMVPLLHVEPEETLLRYVGLTWRCEATHNRRCYKNLRKISGAPGHRRAFFVALFYYIFLIAFREMQVISIGYIGTICVKIRRFASFRSRQLLADSR